MGIITRASGVTPGSSEFAPCLPYLVLRSVGFHTLLCSLSRLHPFFDSILLLPLVGNEKMKNPVVTCDSCKKSVSFPVYILPVSSPLTTSDSNSSAVGTTRRRFSRHARAARRTACRVCLVGQHGRLLRSRRSFRPFPARHHGGCSGAQRPTLVDILSICTGKRRHLHHSRTPSRPVLRGL
jgi:hypothetical protein